VKLMEPLLGVVVGGMHRTVRMSRPQATGSRYLLTYGSAPATCPTL
jgi:hypothetical protein